MRQFLSIVSTEAQIREAKIKNRKQIQCNLNNCANKALCYWNGCCSLCQNLFSIHNFNIVRLLVFGQSMYVIHLLHYPEMWISAELFEEELFGMKLIQILHISCLCCTIYTVVWHTMNEWSRKKRIGEKRFGCRLMESVDNRPINRHQTVAICVSLIMENTKLNRAKFERYLTQYSVLCNKSA